MNSFRIGARLGLAFGIVLLITALIAVIGVLQLGKLRAANHAIATTELQRSLLAQQWASRINTNWVRAAAALKTSDTQYIESLQKDMAATSKAISEGQKTLESMMQDESSQQLMKSVASTRTAYVDARAALIKRQKAGESIADAVDRELRPLAETYLKAVDSVADHAQDTLTRVEATSDAAASTSQVSLAVGAALALAVGAWRMAGLAGDALHYRAAGPGGGLGRGGDPRRPGVGHCRARQG